MVARTPRAVVSAGTETLARVPYPGAAQPGGARFRHLPGPLPHAALPACHRRRGGGARTPDAPRKRHVARSGEAGRGAVRLPVRPAVHPAPPRGSIAAPVVSDIRYGGRPIYFSDVIVPRDSPAGSWDDLRGASWAYNEAGSHSGYLVTLHRLAEMAEPATYFSRWDATGFHERSIDMVASGAVGASAIDSHVLEIALRRRPENRDRVRVVDELGPSTIQPLVATGAASDSLKSDVRQIVIALGDRPEHRERLQQSLVDGFVAVDNESYADIRRMLAAAEAAHLC
ncbi:MAG: hypothetical protein E6J40_12660 [Chloroflexi bacterium]|nr:MAG: hypothetical protein E6J40_12660 [Chloroflexota bacterium]